MPGLNPHGLRRKAAIVPTTSPCIVCVEAGLQPFQAPTACMHVLFARLIVRGVCSQVSVTKDRSQKGKVRLFAARVRAHEQLLHVFFFQTCLIQIVHDPQELEIEASSEPFSMPNPSGC
jgi:hypothetical protein